MLWLCEAQSFLLVFFDFLNIPSENGDYIQDEKHVIFSCIGTEHLRHQFILLFDNFYEGDIKGFVFQHNSSLQIY
jgi:hypothetical protein